MAAGRLIVPIVFKTKASRAREQVAGTAEEIRAKRIVLEAENGKTRAGLTVFKDGKPSLWLADENGKVIWSAIK